MSWPDVSTEWTRPSTSQGFKQASQSVANPYPAPKPYPDLTSQEQPGAVIRKGELCHSPDLDVDLSPFIS